MDFQGTFIHLYPEFVENNFIICALILMLHFTKEIFTMFVTLFSYDDNIFRCSCGIMNTEISLCLITLYLKVVFKLLFVQQKKKYWEGSFPGQWGSMDNPQ